MPLDPGRHAEAEISRCLWIFQQMIFRGLADFSGSRHAPASWNGSDVTSVPPKLYRWLIELDIQERDFSGHFILATSTPCLRTAFGTQTYYYTSPRRPQCFLAPSQPFQSKSILTHSHCNLCSQQGGTCSNLPLQSLISAIPLLSRRGSFDTASMSRYPSLHGHQGRY